MNVKNIDLLNTGLMMLSLWLAYLMPFELFLLVYAILGPLHYLTEINWLDQKSYFVNWIQWKWMAVALAFLFCLPWILLLTESVDVSIIREYQTWNNGFVLMVLGLAIGLVFFKKKIYSLGLMAAFGLLSILLREVPEYNLWIGIFLPTIIHVYLFTAFFMLYGTLKSKSSIGYLNIGLMVLIPFLIGYFNIDGSEYVISDSTKEMTMENGFHVAVAHLSDLVGYGDGPSFYFHESFTIKVQIFVTWIYLYHYLNWFSKTTVIGWHKRLTKKRAISIGVVWGLSVALYTINYKTGVGIVLFLSILHVFLEFPLNLISIRQVGDRLFPKELN